MEIAIAMTQIMTTLAFALATGSFMVVCIGFFTLQTFGSMNNILVSLFMILVTGLLFAGNLRVLRSWSGDWQEKELETTDAEGPFKRSARVLQTKKGSTRAN